MKVLSFLIPAYNSEKFLDICIPSMLHLTLLEKIEIIVINNGSEDSTAAVAEEYCRQYPDTVRVISQANKCHGGALNTGCAAAKGKYIKVIDSDDWVVTENLPRFLSLLERCESDVVLTHYQTFNVSSNETKNWTSCPGVFEKEYTLQEVMADWRCFYHLLTFHGITYRTDFYRKYGIQLPEHVFYEDYEFATFPCCYAESITPLDVFVYVYRIGDANQSVSDENKLRRIGHIETVLRDMVSQYNRACLTSSGQDYVATKTQELLLSYFTVALLSHPNKKTGREMAHSMMAHFRENFPKAYQIAYNKYRVFCLMNYLHISKQTWEKILQSSLYKRLRNRAK